MKRTTAAGAAAGNLYTEGDPGLSIPATVVGSEEMNNIQEELCNVIEDAGITLDGGVDTQLLAALNALMAGGGTTIPAITLTNNSADQDVGIQLDKAIVKGANIFFDIERTTDSNDTEEMGCIFLRYDTKDDIWRDPIVESRFGDAGTTFSIDDGIATPGDEGKLYYTTSDLVGSTYVGKLRISNIEYIYL